MNKETGEETGLRKKRKGKIYLCVTLTYTYANKQNAAHACISVSSLHFLLPYTPDKYLPQLCIHISYSFPRMDFPSFSFVLNFL